MSINKAYTREIRDNLNYTATWLPNLKLALGDVGVLSGYQFTYRTNLNQLGIRFQERPPGAAAKYSHISSDAVTRDLKLAGKAPIAGSSLAEADAGITFTFKRKHAIVFLATNCAIRTVVDQDALKRQILAAYKAGKWDDNYVVVTELVSAGSTSVIISEGSAGRYELKAKAGLEPSLDAMNVAGNFSLAHESQIGFQFSAEAGLTPLFRCLGLNWLRNDVSTRADVLSASTGPVGAEVEHSGVAVDEVEYDDFAADEPS